VDIVFAYRGYEFLFHVIVAHIGEHNQTILTIFRRFLVAEYFIQDFGSCTKTGRKCGASLGFD